MNFKSETFSIATFKTMPCQIMDQSHNKKHCIYYHNDNDKRRNPQQYEYNCDICAYGRSCSKSDLCSFSHNKVEQLYHPNRYKTKYCQSKQQDCQYGVFCTFAHSDDEINIPIKLHLHPRNTEFWIYLYKTIWCPCIAEHDRALCVYAHNAQDFRRDPQGFQINPTECPNWNKSQSVTNYEQGGCKEMYNCQFCHGWKELEYHPYNYKTKRCSYGLGCPKRNNDCAYSHDNNDKRQKPQIKNLPNQNQLSDTFLKQQKIPENQKKLNKQSNFNQPIMPGPNHLQQQINNDRRKMHIGQPFEVFSSRSLTVITAQTSTGSRKMSDMSQDPKNTQDFQSDHNRITKKMNPQSPKKNRTAPSTPEQKEWSILMKKDTTLQLISYSPFSVKFQVLLQKFSVSIDIYCIQRNQKSYVSYQRMALERISYQK